MYERTNPLIYDPKTNSARSSKQAVAVSPSEPAEVEPATDGATNVVVGTAGTPRYGWTGKHETDRNFAAGRGSGTTVVGEARHGRGPYVNERDFSLTYETIDWSQARYDDYGFIALDVTPDAPGQRTTMVLRFINDRTGSSTGWCSPGSVPAPELQDRPALRTCDADRLLAAGSS